MSSPTHAPELLLARASRPDALLDGVLVVRWCVLAWLVVLVVFPGADAPTGGAGPWLAAAALLLTGGWTLLLTLRRPAWGTATLVADAVVCALLLLVATAAPGLATVYPVAAALSWGARRGTRGGALVGAALGALFVTAHLVTGLVPGRAEPGLLEVLGNAFSLALAGAGTGLVSTLLQRSAAEVAAAQADRARAREEAARLAEREEIGRQVHDSVLQVLTLVHKRGREIAATDPVDPRAVAGLAELAAEQERSLRDLVLRPVLASPAPGPAAGPGCRTRAQDRWPTPAAPRSTCARGWRTPPAGAPPTSTSRSVPSVTCTCRRRRSPRSAPPSTRPSATSSGTPAPGRRGCSPSATGTRWPSASATTAAGSSSTRTRCGRRGGSGCCAASAAGSSSSAGGWSSTPPPDAGPSWSCVSRPAGPARATTMAPVPEERVTPVRVVVVDDHPMWRDGVRADLERDGAFLVVAEAGDVDEAVRVVTAHRPELVLMDLSMPGGSGSEATARILAVLPDTRVLVLSASAEQPDVLAAVKAGAAGYLLKSSTGAVLVQAARQVVDGEPVFSPSLAALVLGEFRRVAAGGAEPAGTGLTERETEILRYVAKGYAYKEVADRLVISVRTVQNHVQHILRKLQLGSRYELMRFAIDQGLDRDV